MDGVDIVHIHFLQEHPEAQLKMELLHQGHQAESTRSTLAVEAPTILTSSTTSASASRIPRSPSSTKLESPAARARKWISSSRASSAWSVARSSSLRTSSRIIGQIQPGNGTSYHRLLKHVQEGLLGEYPIEKRMDPVLYMETVRRKKVNGVANGVVNGN
jgi:hypothetical protein